MNKYRPTLKDVARLAGVSVSTVSRVSSEHPDVSEETRQRVEEAMKALAYRPSTLARGLVSGRSLSLGLLVSDITNPFYPQLAQAIEEQANEEGYVVLLVNTGDIPERTAECLNRLIDHGVDGIIHASIGLDEALLPEFLQHGIPFVFVNRRPRQLKNVDVVAFDSFGGARQAARHLLELGHRRIALITGLMHISTEQDRFAGYQAELEAAGVAFDPALVAHLETYRRNGFNQARQMLAADLRPTAFIANDVVAYGILDALATLKLKAPDDISLIGFGGVDSTNLGPAAITTVSSRIREIGKAGCQRLLAAIRDPKHKPAEVTLEVELIEQGTTGRPPSV